jgi:hypothetical protein
VASRRRFALAIVDAAPGLSVAELDAALRRGDPSLRLLYTTGLDPAALAVAPRPSILAKPFGRADLLLAVRRALDGGSGPG